LLCNTNYSYNNNNNSEEFSLNKYSNKTSSLSLNRTQLALNNMERELSLLKKYLLTEQKENINNNNIFNNNYYETSSLCSSL
jgi:hypothetical protein